MTGHEYKQLETTYKILQETAVTKHYTKERAKNTQTKERTATQFIILTKLSVGTKLSD